MMAALSEKNDIDISDEWGVTCVDPPFELLPYPRPSMKPAATATMFFNAPQRLTPATYCTSAVPLD